MYIISIIFCSCILRLCYSQDSPIVESSVGKISGYYKDSVNGHKYEAYEGIPYALPPIEDRRFMPPEPITPWERMLNATKTREVCIGRDRYPQLNDNTTYVFGLEDCLYLNVYAPIKNADASLPVIIWIYGGAFQYATLIGTEQNYLIEHDVIFITFSYRHGSLGFLSTEDEVVTGNMGLKDQSTAIKWVSENIRFFGGDPKRITLTGLSAGSASVHYHYLSPMSRDLFRSGISFSGTALDSWTQARESRKKAIRLGQLLNCTESDVGEMVKCLRTRPARDIVDAQAYFMPWHLNEFAPFGPVAEKKSKNPFIDRSPIDIINNGDVHDAPWITGVVSEEGLFPVSEFATNKLAFEDLDQNWDQIAPHLLHYYYTIPKEDHAAVAKKARDHYFHGEPIIQDNFIKLMHLVGDRIFAVDAEKAAKAQAKVNRNPVYFYYYSYRANTSISEYDSKSTENFGVCHGDDAYLVLANPIMDPEKTPEDFAMHENLLEFWLTIALEGVPNFGPKWTPVNGNTSTLHYLHMIKANDFKEEDNGNFGEKSFWQSIRFNENIPTKIDN